MTAGAKVSFSVFKDAVGFARERIESFMIEGISDGNLK